ncbi:MAG: alpha/beta fold hydrolase [Alistipes sp.]|nr:alpha/beta fold hydrolase [Alistipes sp.]
MRRFILSMIFILSSWIVLAQGVNNTTTLVGSWIGKLSFGSKGLNIGLNIVQSDGYVVCTLDSPDQGVKGIGCHKNILTDEKISVVVPAIGASYEAELVEEKLVGTFSQGGLKLPLTLERGEYKPVRPQTPTAPFSYTTEEVVFINEAEGAKLSGTLTYPVNFENYKKCSVPVVLMVTGSGGQNRDEEIYDHKPFLVIADFLAKNGIASLRYDDRGVGKSTGPTKNTTTENNLADAEAGIAYLRSLKKFGEVGVLGHSEGGTIAFMMGANKSVDFIISLAGAAATGIDVIVGQNGAVMQLQGVPQEIIEDYAVALRIVYTDRINGKEIPDKSEYIETLCQTNQLTLPDNFKSNLAKCITFGGEWLTWFLGYDPVKAISKIKCPVMALNGTLDLQVLSSDNVPVIKANLPKNKKSVIKEYDNLNHLFQHCTPTTALNYGTIEETISEEVLKDIANWIKAL